MTVATQRRSGSPERSRAELARRLGARRPEIERAVLTRVYAISDPSDGADPDPEYVAGLRAAVSAAIEYGLTVVEYGEERAPRLPPALLAQARMAARNGVRLDTVLRRYFAGHAVVSDFLIEEAEHRGLLEPATLQRLLRSQATLFDRLLAMVGEEHTREVSERTRTLEQHRAERIERLLAGELLDTARLAYDFEAHHLGVIAAGPGAEEAIRGLATVLECRLLLAHRGEGTVWAWFGSSRGTDPAEVERLASSRLPARVLLALGEPGQSLAGWRFTHRQARAALTVGLRSQQALVRYADVPLLASMLGNDLLVSSLNTLYLAPLGRKPEGHVLRRTLVSYFAADRTASAAAAALGVTRQTVTNRLHAVEDRLGRSIASCSAELEAALQLAELDEPLG